jgi:hypothetical protein
VTKKARGDKSVAPSAKSRKKNAPVPKQRVTPKAKSAAEKPSVGAKAGSGKWKVALLGFGTVGRSVAKILCEDPASPLVLTHIFNRNIERKRVDGLPESIRWTERIEDVFSSDVDIVVEVVGGVNPPAEWIRTALRSGKSVVTANKLLIADRGAELLSLARETGQRLEFGASVAGGIPAIIAIQEGLAGDRLLKIAGILNGTCNYILTKMESTGASFATALKEAQELGFAEADPRGELHHPANLPGAKGDRGWRASDCGRAACARSFVVRDRTRKGQPEYRDGDGRVRGTDLLVGIRSRRRSYCRGRYFGSVLNRSRRYILGGCRTHRSPECCTADASARYRRR